MSFTATRDERPRGKRARQNGAHSECDTKFNPGHGNDHPTRSPSGAGQGDKVTVKPSDTIAEVLDNEVKHFISKRWLTAGEYALALPRASENELDPLVSD